MNRAQDENSNSSHCSISMPGIPVLMGRKDYTQEIQQLKDEIDQLEKEKHKIYKNFKNSNHHQ